MALIKIEMSMPPVNGMDIKFKAPCDCSQITGLLVEYPEGSKEFTFRDCHGNNLAGIGNLFGAGAYIKVIVDVAKGYAYLQNADNNGFLNSAVFGTYTHDGENLTGYGENGKFKATTSGTISTINVNGVACSVRCGEESSIDLIAGNWYTFILDGDTVNFNSGGAGGGGLNFKVVGSLQPPAPPKENTIWIETDTPITGYEFAPTEPANMTEGMVWISTGLSSVVAFSATKKNPVMVYPISAKQYVNGALVYKTAKIYHAGEWVEWWNGELFDIYSQYEEKTGGWGIDGYSFYAGEIEAGVIDEQGMYLAPTTSVTAAILGTGKPISFAGYTNIHIEGEVYGSDGNMSIHFAVCTQKTLSQNIVAEQHFGTKVGAASYDIPIDALNDEYYIICSTGTSTTCKGRITKIKLS